MANHTPKMVELLPCPFCGHSAAHGDGFMPLESITYVWCSNEDCYLSPVGRDERLFGIDEWNNRSSADVAAVTAQRDELKDQSEYVLRECKEPEALNDESLNICNIATGIRDLRAELEEVAAQRDELLKDLKEMERMRIESIQTAIKKAIAKCEVQNDA